MRKPKSIRELLERFLPQAVTDEALAKAKQIAREDRKAAREPRRIVQVNTAKDVRYRNSGGYGATAPYIPPLKHRKAARPVTQEPRTSVEFRRWERGGFNVRQDNRGTIFAVPVSATALSYTQGQPIPIGHTIS